MKSGAQAYGRLAEAYISDPERYGEPMDAAELADPRVDKHVPCADRRGDVTVVLARHASSPLAFRTRQQARDFIGDNLADLCQWLGRCREGDVQIPFTYTHRECLTPCPSGADASVGGQRCMLCGSHRGRFLDKEAHAASGTRQGPSLDLMYGGVVICGQKERKSQILEAVNGSSMMGSR